MRFVLTKVRAETLRPLRHGPVSRRRPSSETQCVTTHAKRRQALSDTPPWAAAPLVCSGATGQQPRGANTCGCSTAEARPMDAGRTAAMRLCSGAGSDALDNPPQQTVGVDGCWGCGVRCCAQTQCCVCACLETWFGGSAHSRTSDEHDLVTSRALIGCENGCRDGQEGWVVHTLLLAPRCVDAHSEPRNTSKHCLTLVSTHTQPPTTSKSAAGQPAVVMSPSQQQTGAPQDNRRRVCCPQPATSRALPYDLCRTAAPNTAPAAITVHRLVVAC